MSYKPGDIVEGTNTNSGTQVGAAIRPISYDDDIASVLASEIRGGYQSCKGITGIDNPEGDTFLYNIKDSRREIGMLVYVEDNDNTYILKGGIDNTNWEIKQFGMPITGTENVIPKFDGVDALEDSIIKQEDSDVISVGDLLLGKMITTGYVGMRNSHAPNASYAFRQNAVGYTYFNGERLEFRIRNGRALVVDTNKNVGIGTLTPTEKLDVNGNAVIRGDLTVQGTTTSVDTEELLVKDNIIEVNNGEVGPGVTAGTAGIEVDRGMEDNYQFLFDESDDSFKIGEVGDLQVVATRDNLTDNTVPRFDGDNFKLVDSSISVLDNGNVIVDNGNVGIGTATPSSILQVDGISGLPSTVNSLVTLRDKTSNVGFQMGADANRGWIRSVDVLETAIGYGILNLGKDYLFQDDKQNGFNPKKTVKPIFAKHGSGCVLSSAITANLFQGYPLHKSILKSKRYMEGFLSSNKTMLGNHRL
jgi:hypothetical protein